MPALKLMALHIQLRCTGRLERPKPPPLLEQRFHPAKGRKLKKRKKVRPIRLLLRFREHYPEILVKPGDLIKKGQTIACDGGHEDGEQNTVGERRCGGISKGYSRIECTAGRCPY
jgi:hypothetical protein